METCKCYKVGLPPPIQLLKGYWHLPPPAFVAEEKNPSLTAMQCPVFSSPDFILLLGPRSGVHVSSQSTWAEVWHQIDPPVFSTILHAPFLSFSHWGKNRIQGK